jgi:hypothetical protein
MPAELVLTPAVLVDTPAVLALIAIYCVEVALLAVLRAVASEVI